MSKTYAIADLHGRFDLLQAAYARLVESNHSGGTIVHLEDYVDRGPQSRQIIEFLMDEATIPSGWKRVVLTGNHEQIMLAACAAPGLLGWWIGNGGGSTLISYGNPVGGNAMPELVPQEHLRWLQSLPRYHEDAHRLFVHAGVDDGVPLGDQSDDTLLWKLYQDGWDDGYGTKHVVHGHHQFEEGPILMTGRTDLDTLAWYTGRLVIGVFDDDVPGGPRNTIEVRGPHILDLRRTESEEA